MPIALTEPKGHTALELSKTSMLGLDRMGIAWEDIYRTVNDNCLTVRKTSK